MNSASRFVRICSTKGRFNWQKIIALYCNIIGLLIRISVLPSFTKKNFWRSYLYCFMHEIAPIQAMILTSIWFCGDKCLTLPWSELITCDLQTTNVQFSMLIRRNKCASLSLVSTARSFLLSPICSVTLVITHGCKDNWSRTSAINRVLKVAVGLK